MSVTTTSNEGYTSGPFEWMTDQAAWVNGSQCVTDREVGVFCKGSTKIGSIVDNESELLNIGDKIGKCGKDLNVFDNSKYTEPSDFIKGLYSGEHTNTEETFLTPYETRIQKSCNLAGVEIPRFNYLPENPQKADRIFFPEQTRGGVDSRNVHKDNYECGITENRGGNR